MNCILLQPLWGGRKIVQIGQTEPTKPISGALLGYPKAYVGTSRGEVCSKRKAFCYTPLLYQNMIRVNCLSLYQLKKLLEKYKNPDEILMLGAEYDKIYMFLTHHPYPHLNQKSDRMYLY